MTSTISRSAIVHAVPEVGAPVGPDSRAANQDPMPEVAALREHNSRPTDVPPAPVQPSPAGSNSRAADLVAVTEARSLREENSRPTGAFSMPIDITSDGPNSHATDPTPTTEGAASRGSNSRPATDESAAEEHAPDGAQLAARHEDRDAHVTIASGDQQGRDRAANDDAPSGRLSLFDPALSLAADFLDDMERVKIANENRLRALTRVGVDKDGVERYVGLDADHLVVAQYAVMVEAVAKIEHDAVLTLQRMMRKHPLGAWVKAQRGIGEKQAARLLASIGDPYWRPEIVKEDGTVIPEGPRTVSALWAYSGLHVLPAAGPRCAAAQMSDAGGGDSSTGGDSSHRAGAIQPSVAGVAARRRKGEQANWSTKAKTRAYLIAESCLKQLVKPCHTPAEGPTVHVEDCPCSPYRLEYDRRKAHTTESRPEWTDGHRHADALRVASKAILRDLWRAARDWHLAQKESE